MGKMKKVLQEQRKTDSALDAFLAEEGEPLMAIDRAWETFFILPITILRF